MTGHMKEPWEINGCDWDEETDQAIGCQVTDSEFYFVASCEGGRSSDHDNANARRIVDCVNALAGIPDPAAFVEAARGMAEAADGAITGNLIALEKLRSALTAFRQASGETA